MFRATREDSAERVNNVLLTRATLTPLRGAAAVDPGGSGQDIESDTGP